MTKTLLPDIRSRRAKNLLAYTAAVHEFRVDNEASHSEVFDNEWEFDDAAEAFELGFCIGYVTAYAEHVEFGKPSEFLAAYEQAYPDDDDENDDTEEEDEDDDKTE